MLLVGGWVAGGLITNDFTLSMSLTAAWVGLVGLACLTLFMRRRELWPALAAFIVTAAAAGIYLGSETLIDDKVDEDVVTAAPPARAERAPPPARGRLGPSAAGERAARTGRVRVARALDEGCRPGDRGRLR